jgi:ABC-type lipoprotein release transport system permease subunit
MFFTQSMKREASLVLTGSPAVVVQRLVGGRQEPVPLSYMNPVRKIRGVSSVKGRLWGYYYDAGVGANYTLLVPESFSFGTGKISIGKGISRTRLIEEDDVMFFRGYDGIPVNLEVKEIFGSESELVSSDLILLSEGDFRRLLGMSKDYVTDLTVEVRNARELLTIATKIVQLLPDTRPILREEISRTYDTVFDWRGGIIIVVLSGAVMAFIIFAWDKASGLSAEERKEIGILKAIGWETSDILQMKFWEGVTISLTSFLLGVLLAYVHVFFASASLFKPVLIGWSVLYPEFELTPSIDAYQVATLFFLTVVPYTVTTIIPSWRAATIDPDTVMRG